MKKVAILGGDKRAVHLAALCEADGFAVSTWGLCPGDEASFSGMHADILLFPYPFSIKDQTIFNQRGLRIDPALVLSLADEDSIAVMGQDLKHHLPQRPNFHTYDEDDHFLQANADISAEGALSYAMCQLDCTLAGTRHLVVGYGLFGRALAQKLRALGGHVTVAARGEKARSSAMLDGMEAIPMEAIPSVASITRLLLNTVPAQVIDHATLSVFPKNALLLELASAPYGFHREEAEALGLANALLPGIPGRYAPESAAKALLCAMNTIRGKDT